MECQRTDMNEFVELCTKEFFDNEKLSQDLHRFSNDYKSEEALRWYTKPIFLFSLINKALRLQNIELLFLLRFFMRDIHRELTNNQCQSLVKVYRGQLIASDEIDILKNSIGDLISMKSFLSTSLDRQKAAFYIEGASLSPSNQSDSKYYTV
ncbi:unnamed protein product [Rotaria sp. Silwood1]|nr:unnamed protein product [Rotaria sp. Silwood1]